MQKCVYVLQVTKVPNFRYKHVGTEVHVGPVDNHPELPFFTDIPDHAATKYITNIANDQPVSAVHDDETGLLVQLANRFKF